MHTSNHRTKKAVAERGKVELSEYQGLMPDPSVLKDLQELVPDIAERWMKIAESEISSRQKNDRTIMTTYRNSTYIGMASAFIVSLCILGVGFYACYMGEFTSGTILITSSLATNVIAWISRKSKTN